MEDFTLYAACIHEIGPISLEAGFELLDISTGRTVYFMMHFFGVRVLTTHAKIEKGHVRRGDVVLLGNGLTCVEREKTHKV